MDIENVDKNPSRRSIYHNPTAKSFQAPETKDNSAELRAWYSSLPDYAPTKLVPLPDLAAELGIRSVYVKAETFRLGLPSFKLLGASWAVRQAIIQSAKIPSSASLDDLRAAVKQNGVKLCAATDGNHGRSVAFMGRILGVEEIKVFVPRGLDKKIIASIVNEGANVVITDGDYDQTVRTAHRFGEETEGFILIEAVAYEGYEDIPRWAVEGYTTMFREIDAQLLIHARILKQDQPLSMIIAPVGVGSLTQAIISYYKSPNKTSAPPAVVTVEPDTAATLHKSLKAGESLSITTSPTIMAGLECGTLSSIAWPLLKAGVDISTTISDLECHHAIEYMAKYGIGAGPCGGAALGGLRRFAADSTGQDVLNKDSVVVCICTEGTRPYTLPTPVAGLELTLTGALMVLHMTPGIESNFRLSPQIVPVSAFMNFAAQWLEYRDIDVKWVYPGLPNASLVARLPVAPGVHRDRERKLLFMITHVPSKCKREPQLIHTSLGATLLALAKLKLSTPMAGGDITLVIVHNQAGLKSVIETVGAPEAALVVDAENENLITLQSEVHTAFAGRVKQSVETALGKVVTITKTLKSQGTIWDLLKESNIPLCVVGDFGGSSVDDQGEESEYVLAKALAKVGED